MRRLRAPYDREERQATTEMELVDAAGAEVWTHSFTSKVLRP